MRRFWDIFDTIFDILTFWGSFETFTKLEPIGSKKLYLRQTPETSGDAKIARDQPPRLNGPPAHLDIDPHPRRTSWTDRLQAVRREPVFFHGIIIHPKICHSISFTGLRKSRGVFWYKSVLVPWIRRIIWGQGHVSGPTIFFFNNAALSYATFFRLNRWLSFKANPIWKICLRNVYLLISFFWADGNEDEKE